MFSDAAWPPIRPGLMLMMRPLPRLIMSDARSGQVIDRRMAHEIVVCQGLFDHEESKGVELPQRSRLIERVGTVGVYHDRCFVPECFPNRPHERHVRTGRDLQLDSSVSLGEGGPCTVGEGFRVLLDPQRDARGDCRPRSAQDPRAESQPGSVHGLWRIVRCLARNAFPPSHHPVRPDDLHQGDAALMRSPG